MFTEQNLSLQLNVTERADQASSLPAAVIPFPERVLERERLIPIDLSTDSFHFPTSEQAIFFLY